MLTNIFLKFSELAKVRDENAPFSNNYGTTAASTDHETDNDDETEDFDDEEN